MVELNTLPGVSSREAFAQLCNVRGYKWAAEIGTDRGIFARDFLDHWIGEMLWCVDPYTRYDEMPWDRTGDLFMAMHLLAPHARRVRFMRLISDEAAAWFTHQRIKLDFVYIDGSHSAYNVERDLEKWWPLVRPGGVLAGDDYDDSTHCPDVKVCVNAFVQRMGGMPLYVTQDYNRAASWYLEKP